MDSLQFACIAEFYIPADLARMTDRQKAIAIQAVQTCLASWTMERKIPLSASSARFFRTTPRTLARCFPAAWYLTAYDHLRDTSTDYVRIPDDVTFDSLRGSACC